MPTDRSTHDLVLCWAALSAAMYDANRGEAGVLYILHIAHD
jgi:hypothetical protein